MFSLWVSTQFITEALGAIDLEDQHSVQLGWNIVSLVEVVRCAVVVVGGQLQVRWWKGVFVDRWINSAASGDIPHCRLAHCRQSVQLQLVKFSSVRGGGSIMMLVAALCALVASVSADSCAYRVSQ